MGSRWCIFQHGEVGVVLAGLARIGTQAFDAKIRESEALDFRNIHRSITVNQIGGGTMCLIAGDGTMTMSPGCPLAGEVFQ